MFLYNKLIFFLLFFAPIQRLYTQCKDNSYQVVSIRGGNVWNATGQLLKKGDIVYSTAIEQYKVEPSNGVSVTFYSKKCGKICMIRSKASGKGLERYWGWAKKILGWETEEYIAGSKGGCDVEIKRLQQIFLIPDENDKMESNFYTFKGNQQIIKIDTSCFPLSKESFFGFEYIINDHLYKTRIENIRDTLTINLAAFDGFKESTIRSQDSIHVHFNYYDFGKKTKTKISIFTPYFENENEVIRIFYE